LNKSCRSNISKKTGKKMTVDEAKDAILFAEKILKISKEEKT